jgi:hypothetical protein
MDLPASGSSRPPADNAHPERPRAENVGTSVDSKGNRSLPALPAADRHASISPPALPTLPGLFPELVGEAQLTPEFNVVNQGAPSSWPPPSTTHPLGGLPALYPFMDVDPGANSDVFDDLDYLLPSLDNPIEGGHLLAQRIESQDCQDSGQFEASPQLFNSSPTDARCYNHLLQGLDTSSVPQDKPLRPISRSNDGPWTHIGVGCAPPITAPSQAQLPLETTGFSSYPVSSETGSPHSFASKSPQRGRCSSCGSERLSPTTVRGVPESMQVVYSLPSLKRRNPSPPKDTGKAKRIRELRACVACNLKKKGVSRHRIHPIGLLVEDRTFGRQH